MATANFPWPNRNSPQQPPATTATVVDTNPPQSLSPWTQREPLQRDLDSWPKPEKKTPARAPRRRPPAADAMAFAARSPRSVGGWLVVCSLLACAVGLSAASAVGHYADAAVDAGMGWLTTRAPGFLRPYLPKPVEKSAAPVLHHANVHRLVAAEPPPAPELTTGTIQHGKHGKHTHATESRVDGPATPVAHKERVSDPFDR